MESVTQCNCEFCRKQRADYAAKKAQGTILGSGSTPMSNRTARLQYDAVNLSDQLQRTTRAADILRRHPEFEEFIELLGLIRVEIRQTPLQSEKALVLE